MDLPAVGHESRFSGKNRLPQLQRDGKSDITETGNGDVKRLQGLEEPLAGSRLSSARPQVTRPLPVSASEVAAPLGEGIMVDGERTLERAQTPLKAAS